MAGRLLHGLGASGAFTVALALLNENVSRHRLGQMNGLGQVGFAVSLTCRNTTGSLANLYALFMRYRLVTLFLLPWEVLYTRN